LINPVYVTSTVYVEVHRLLGLAVCLYEALRVAYLLRGLPAMLFR